MGETPAFFEEDILRQSTKSRPARVLFLIIFTVPIIIVVAVSYITTFSGHDISLQQLLLMYAAILLIHVTLVILVMRAFGRQKKVEMILQVSEEKLKKAHATLELKVHERTTELEESKEQLQHLTEKLQTIQEEEAKRIARRIHDQLGQELTILKLQIAALEKDLKNETHKPAEEETLKTLTDLSDKTDHIIEAVRDIYTELRPWILDEIGLNAALEWQTKEFSKKTGVHCHYTAKGDQLNFQSGSTILIFRIVQEIFSNIARHAEASEVQILLEQHDDLLALQIEDNGRGIRNIELHDPRSLGILGMQERAHMLGGKIKIRAKKDRGTIVTLFVPLPLKKELTHS